jgi:hypothetical protein
MKKIIILLLAVVSITITSCSDADVASQNLSKAAEQFEIYRRVVFYNGITDKYILQIEFLDYYLIKEKTDFFSSVIGEKYINISNKLFISIINKMRLNMNLLENEIDNVITDIIYK